MYSVELQEDGTYDVVFAGPCRGGFLGMTDEEAAGEHWPDYVHPDDRELFDVVHRTVHALGRLDVEYRIVTTSGEHRWVRDRGRVREEDGRVFLDGSVLDTTELHAMQQQLVAARAEAHTLAYTDELTGLANRRGLATMVALARNEPLGFLLIDLDHFKAVNDRYGHAVGDHVLRAVGARLRDSVRRGDAAIRMGGEEFLLILRGIEHLDQLRMRGNALLEAFRSRPVKAPTAAIPVTASIGAVLTGPGEPDLDATLRAADDALYAAKAAGRDRLVVQQLPVKTV